MSNTLLSIHELVPGKLYDMVDNPYPNHIQYYVEEDGSFWNRDEIVKTQGKNRVEYNDALKLRFFEIAQSFKRYKR